MSEYGYTMSCDECNQARSPTQLERFKNEAAGRGEPDAITVCKDTCSAKYYDAQIYQPMTNWRDQPW